MTVSPVPTAFKAEAVIRIRQHIGARLGPISDAWPINDERGRKNSSPVCSVP